MDMIGNLKKGCDLAALLLGVKGVDLRHATTGLDSDAVQSFSAGMGIPGGFDAEGSELQGCNKGAAIHGLVFKIFVSKIKILIPKHLD